MSPLKLFASIRERRRRSALQSLEEGTQIMRRLQELLAVPSPTQEVAAPFTKALIENEPTGYREGRLDDISKDHVAYSHRRHEDRRQREVECDELRHGVLLT
jgi:hypothetical protein